MKKILLSIIFSICIYFANAQSNTWTAMSSTYPTTIGQITGFVIGTKAYVGTGCAGFGLPWFWEWNSVTDTWTQMSDFPDNRYEAAAFAIGSKGYVGTGEAAGGSVTLDTFYEYDPATNTWTAKAAVPGGARYSAVGFAIGTKGYIGLGYGHSDLQEYNPASNTWTTKASWPSNNRYDAVAMVINSKAYVGTGTPYATTNFYEYNPANNTWTTKATYPGGNVMQCIAFSVQSKGYVGTGFPETSHFYEYDPASDTWAQKASVPGQHLRNAFGFAVGTKGYVTTGDNGDGATGGQFNIFQSYSPSLVGIDEIGNDLKVSVYPNPSNGKIFVKDADQQNQFENISVYNSTGELVKILKNPVDQITDIDLSDQSDGNYFIQVSNGERKYVQKVLIEK